tara:strand:+ start:47 stop:256 length:210 start_codon:yes stop_codon:yes gene_type:complete
MARMDGKQAIRQRLVQLRLEHRDLNELIDRLGEQNYADQLHLRRLKKRRLALKDATTRLESMLIPNLDA